MQRILVMSTELHKSHVGTLRELRYAANTREESEELELSMKCCFEKDIHPHLLEHILNGNNGIAICEGVLLRRIGQLLIDYHHVLGQINSRSQQVVQAVDGAEHPINLGNHSRRLITGTQRGRSV